VVILAGLGGVSDALGQISSDASVYAPMNNYAFIDAQGPSATMDDAGTLIRLNEAHTKYPTINGSGYTIAVLDTGVDFNHPALSGRYVGGYDYINGDSNPNDDNGHGTHVTGIAASNDATYTGIAPQAGFAAVKVLDSSGSGSFTQIESGLQWVIANRATHNIVAVNMSIGTSDTYNANVMSMISDELSTLKAAGVFIAVASGNGWFNNQPNEGVAYPAADASAVAVGDVWTKDFGSIGWSSGAIDYTTAADRIVSHCDRSTTMLDIFGPGALITSASHNWEDGPDYVTMGGTSMASPTVAGLAVLIREAIEEHWDPADWPTGSDWQDTILQIMQDNAVIINDGDDEYDNVTNLNHDFPRIDVLASLDATVVPEPATMSLLVVGVFAILRRKRK